MDGDIDLYEAWVVDKEPSFTFKGRSMKQGKSRTCIHRMLVSAFSAESAECLTRYASYKMFGYHPDDVCISRLKDRVEYVGKYAIPNKDFEAFKKDCVRATCLKPEA